MRPARWAGAAVVAPVLLLLIADGTGGWLFGWNKDWLEGHVPQVQNEINGLHNVYGVDNRLVKLQAELNLKNALIFVPGCGFDGSNLACYDTVFNENSLDFNGDVVRGAKCTGSKRARHRSLPRRVVCVATWELLQSSPHQPEPPFAGETP
jgi:hypothetical protein